MYDFTCFAECLLDGHSFTPRYIISAHFWLILWFLATLWWKKYCFYVVWEKWSKIFYFTPFSASALFLLLWHMIFYPRLFDLKRVQRESLVEMDIPPHQVKWSKIRVSTANYTKKATMCFDEIHTSSNKSAGFMTIHKQLDYFIVSYLHIFGDNSQMSDGMGKFISFLYVDLLVSGDVEWCCILAKYGFYFIFIDINDSSSFFHTNDCVLYLFY